MGSPENPTWLLNCPLMDDMPITGGDFSAPAAGGFYWPNQVFGASPDVSVEIDGSFAESDGVKESGTRKRGRSESCSLPGSKACREKMRRDRLNDKFLELGSILEPGKPPKMDKAAILGDAARMVTQLRSEAEKLKDSNENLQEKIRELKAEKNELRDEKQRLKAEKENLEQQIKLLNARPSFVPHPPMIPTAYAPAPAPAPVPGQVHHHPGHKLMMPVYGFPGFHMYQLMPAADVDTSQDAESCPPVA